MSGTRDTSEIVPPQCRSIAPVSRQRCTLGEGHHGNHQNGPGGWNRGDWIDGATSESRTAGSVERTNGGHYFADLPDGTCIGVYLSRADAWAALSYFARTGERPGAHVRTQLIVGPPPQGMASDTSTSPAPECRNVGDNPTSAGGAA